VWSARNGWLAIAVFAASGCIPLPAALPPAKASLGVGAAIGNPLPDAEGQPLSEAEPVALGRVGVTVQSLWPEQHRRPLEVEAGYAFQLFTDRLRQNRNRHGVYAGLAVHAGDWWLGKGWRGRLTLRGSAAYFVLQDHPGDGGGGSWAIGFEAAHYTRHEGGGGDGLAFWGLAAGEWSIGAELVGGVHSVGGAEYGTVGFALTGRWPGLLGVGIIPLSGSF
jgi:hypothetical protein